MNIQFRSAPQTPVGARKPLIIGFVLVVLATVVYFYQRHLAQPIHTRLEQEFDQVPPSQGSVALNHESTYKAGTALVQTEYRTKSSFSDVKTHYNSELSRNGWHLVSERIIEGDGRRSRLEEVVFCKGSYAASVSRRGQDASDFTFWFALSWGLHDCK